MLPRVEQSRRAEQVKSICGVFAQCEAWSSGAVSRCRSRRVHRTRIPGLGRVRPGGCECEALREIESGHAADLEAVVARHDLDCRAVRSRVVPGVPLRTGEQRIRTAWPAAALAATGVATALSLLSAGRFGFIPSFQHISSSKYTSILQFAGARKLPSTSITRLGSPSVSLSLTATRSEPWSTRS